MGQARSLLLFIFGLFKQNWHFYRKYMWKNVHPVYGFELTTFEHESPPITTRPGLPPFNEFILFTNVINMDEELMESPQAWIGKDLLLML